MRLLCSLLLSWCLLSSVWAEEPVPFPDPELKAAVERTLWLSDPTPTDMLGLTQLSAIDMGIIDLTGLEYAANLQTLCLTLNSISDLSPLSGLANLRDICVNHNQINDLSSLSNLPALETLVLDNNRVSRFPTFSGLPNLRHLDAHDNRLTDISGVASLTNLRTLILRHNQINDLSGLSSLTRLSELNLIDNQVTGLAPLAGATSLQTLLLRNNRCSDLSPLSGLSNLRTLNLSSNEVKELLPLSGLSNLETLTLHLNHIQDISALAALTSLEYVGLISNRLNYQAYEVYIPQIIANNPGVSIAYDARPQCRLSISSTAGGRVTDPGEGTVVCDSGEDVHFRAEADPGFVFNEWSGSLTLSRNPAWCTVTRDYEIRAHFLSMLEVIAVDDDASGDPGPGDSEVGDPQEDGTVAHPFDSIQEAIEVAADGASVVVRPGTYRERIDFLGKGIQLIGIDPNEPNDVAFPVIDGAGSGPVVTIAGGEGSDCVLAGFVVTRGEGDLASAIYCEGSSPTIANCLIVANRAVAAVYCNGSEAVFVNCTIADNAGGVYLLDSNVVLANSILWGNAVNEIVVDGASEPYITYSDIAGGWPGPGNIEVDPLFAQPGWWADPNDPNVVLGPGVDGAVWMDGDYHLRSEAGRWDAATRSWVQDEATSPCIDAGAPVDPVGAEPVPNGSIVNLGAYGGTSQATKSK